MTEQWQELKETITEMRDNGGTGTQQEVCKFLANYMEILEKQMQQPCEDCISREYLINKISSVDGLEGVENSNLFAKHYMDIVKSAPSVTPKQTNWIPVTERLPEEDGQYLITVKYKPEADYENIYAEHGEWTDGRWDMFCFGHCGEVESIVAWMPLPEPYKAESEDKE